MPRLILDPLGEANCEQTMWGAVWIEPQYGMYLGLYAPTRFDGKLDLAFAASRDGIHFYRIKNGSRALRFSAGGQWDSGFLEVGAEWTAFSGPIRMGDKVWLYYGGTPYHLGVYGEPVSGRTDRIQGQSYVGIATMRADGWAYLTPSENEYEGHVTTVPLTSDLLGGCTLKVNAEGLDNGKLEAEVLDSATNEPVAGYTRKDSIAVSNDGINNPVAWRGNQRLPEGSNREFRLRFYLEGARARFYGFRLDNCSR
jgi:hypothetical protein